MGIGVRTRITDDLLWLPYCTAAYIQSTGDSTILKELVPYIKGPVLDEDQHDVMFTPEISERSESGYEHCKKTIDRTFFGEHGLPLMGGGDWNDGMNEVGIKGKGESVWLAWFFYTVLGDFIPLCYQEDDAAYGQELEQKRVQDRFHQPVLERDIKRSKKRTGENGHAVSMALSCNGRGSPFLTLGTSI